MTERAADALMEMLTADQAPSDQGVKLVPDSSGGLAMTIAPPGKGDEVVRQGERPLLIIDAEMIGRVDGALLDFTRGTDHLEPRFELREPSSPG
jgi:hypothetical protein